MQSGLLSVALTSKNWPAATKARLRIKYILAEKQLLNQRTSLIHFDHLSLTDLISILELSNGSYLPDSMAASDPSTSSGRDVKPTWPINDVSSGDVKTIPSRDNKPSFPARDIQPTFTASHPSSPSIVHSCLRLPTSPPPMTSTTYASTIGDSEDDEHRDEDALQTVASRWAEEAALNNMNEAERHDFYKRAVDNLDFENNTTVADARKVLQIPATGDAIMDGMSAILFP